MKKIIVIFILIFCCVAACAQDSDELSWIKSEIASKLEDNRRLQSQYDMLLFEVNDLKDKIASAKEEMTDLNTRMAEEASIRDDRSTDMERAYRDLKSAAMALRQKQDRYQFLQAKIREMDVRQDIRELKMRDLEYQRQEWELEKEGTDRKYQGELATRKQEWAAVAETIIALRTEQKGLEEKLAEMEQILPQIPTRMQELRTEISQLETKVMELAGAKALQSKQQDILKSKQLLAEKKQELTLVPLTKEKEYLQGEIKELQAAYEDLEKKVQESMAYQQKKRVYLNEMMRLDQENRQLQQDIESVRKAKGR